MNEASTSSPLRRRLWPRRSELMRPTDWIEATVLVALITAALVLVPVALAMGSETYADQTRVSQEQSRTRHLATATLLQDAPPTSVGTRGETVSGVADVPARWTLADGTERSGTVPATKGAKSGSPVSIWLDDAGNLAPEPITHEEAAMAGVAIAMGMWVVTAAGLCVVFLLTRAVLNRSRSAAWQWEWASVEPDWTRST